MNKWWFSPVVTIILGFSETAIPNPELLLLDMSHGNDTIIKAAGTSPDIPDYFIGNYHFTTLLLPKTHIFVILQSSIFDHGLS